MTNSNNANTNAKLERQATQIRKMRKALNACLRTDFIYHTDQLTGVTPYDLIVKALARARS